MNVIEALIVTLSLDPSGFSKGQKEVGAGQKAMREDAEKTAKTLNEQSKHIGEGIAQVRDQVIGLFAAFTAGRGLKEFVSALTSSDSALGRTANNIGVSTDQLSAWQGVAERAGGSAQGITSSMQGLSQQFQQLALTGQSAVVPYFRAIGVAIADSSGKMRPMQDILFDLSDKLSHLEPAKAQAIGRGLGLDEGTVNVLIKGKNALTALLAEQEKIGHANAADAASAQKRQAAFRALSQASEDLGRKLLTTFTPAILAVTNALTKFSEWAATHRPLVEAAFLGIAGAVTAFAAVLAAPLAGIAALSVAIGAAISAIALLYDDWKTWTQGGKAEFAGFWQFFSDKWVQLKNIVQPTIEALKVYWSDLWQTVKDGWRLVVQLFTGDADGIRSAWSKLWGDFGEDVKGLVDVFRNLGPLMLDAFKSAFNGAIDWAEGRLEALHDAIFGKKAKPAQYSVAPPISGEKSAAGGAYGAASSDVEKLVGMGWTRDQAIGIVANLQRESSGNISTIGDKGAAFGLAQWHPDRQADFAAWAGHDIRQSTRDEQLAFINYELTAGKKSSVGAALRGTSSASEAASLVSRRYEVPFDAAGEAQKRAALASALSAGPLPDSALTAGGGAFSAVAGSVTNTNSNQSMSNSVTINGGIQVQTQATDAQGIARTIGAQVNRYSAITAQANYALAP